MIYYKLILFLYALIFVIEAIIRAILRRAEHKALQFILVQVDGADVGVEVLVVIVIDAGFAVRRLAAYFVFGEFLHGFTAFFNGSGSVNFIIAYGDEKVNVIKNAEIVKIKNTAVFRKTADFFIGF